MPKYILCYAQTHESFRFPELTELQKLSNVQISILHEYYEPTIPLIHIDCESEEYVCKLVSRSVLIKKVVEYWTEGSNIENLALNYKAINHINDFTESSHKFLIEGIGRSFSLPEQIEYIEKLNFFGFKGKINLKTPQQTFNLIFDYGPLVIKIDDISPDQENDNINKDNTCVTQKKKKKFLKNTNLITTTTIKPDINSFRKVYFGREITKALTSRYLMNKYNLKTRKYLGNTSMEAEMSLIAANMASASPGKFIYDPFVGTGSLLLVCSEFGAYTFGSDIDGRQIRGTAGFRTGVGGINSNIKEYNLEPLILGNFVADITNCPIRPQAFLDAIITDPPYGVRAGAKKLGRKTGAVSARSLQLIDGIPNHARDDYYPPTVPYEMSDVIVDLLTFAATFLVVGGRLVFWLPTVTEEYSDSDIPTNNHLKLIANSEQNFGAWTRRLITMEKILYQVPDLQNTQEYPFADDFNKISTESNQNYIKNISNTPEPMSQSESPAHKNFREKYFTGFEKLNLND
ncbi:hypothetical protein BB561_002743 [Smittium simulii]|uniref:tRNA (guanine(10)-N(2))-methyltransferase n=1 Tax=Smittium simulii TaxID=133385 RepID=A0A2T9YPA2_9FUNG|nr:hypothetical protein BB561_002743 [Smittium simulii]